MRTITMMTAAAATAVTLLAAGCNADNADPNLTVGSTGKAAAKKKDGQHTVVYIVRGAAGRADITYSTPSGIEQHNGVKLPWKKTLKVGRGESLSVDASAGELGGKVSCEIDLDGKPYKRATGSGQYASATCDGMTDF